METWTVSDYMGRMERACLDIQERRTPVERTITLWWGLDGLRLAEDGSMEWASRRQERPGPVQYAPPALIQPPVFPSYEDFICRNEMGLCVFQSSVNQPLLFCGGQSSMENVNQMRELNQVVSYGGQGGPGYIR